MADSKEFLGKEPVGKLLFKLGIPTVVAQLINMLYNIVDRIYIGHMPGEGSLALTGVGVCLPILMIVTAFASFVASGSAPRASIALGRGDLEESEKILGGSVTLQLGISLVLTLILVFFHRPILLKFGASSQTIGYASAYMSIYALGTVFVELTLGLNAFITAQGKARISMMTVLIGAVLNIVLDPLFIFVFHLGIRGAAFATILSQGVSALWCVCYLSSSHSTFRIKTKNLLASPKLILPCVALGTASFIMVASESIISVCFNSSLLKYGGDIAVGAMTICSSALQFAMLPVQGLAQGSQPILSYNYGAKKADRVKKTYLVLCGVAFTYTFLIWAFIELFPSLMAGIFTSDPSLVDFASKALRAYCACLFLFGIQISCQMAFVSIGAALNSIIVAVVRKFVLLIPIMYILPHLVSNQTMGVYLAEPVADCCAVLFTVCLFAKEFKKALAKLN